MRKTKVIGLMLGICVTACAMLGAGCAGTGEQASASPSESASAQQNASTDESASPDESAAAIDTENAPEEASDNAPASATGEGTGPTDGSYNPTAYAEIKIKGYDPITVGLDANVAPKTVENFIDLAESGFYDGLTFHRIMDGFMMQGGDPEGTGMGGSDKNVVGEFLSNGVENPFSHTRGAISMARSQDPDSASSQFFIVQSDSTFLDGEYAAFGYVENGMDVVDAICAAAQPIDGNGSIEASQQPVIETISITEA